MIVLIGFMAAGKSTVGSRLAERLGLPFVDVDEVLAAEAGVPIAAIFATSGESSFRARERAVSARVLEGPEAVVALGGGAVTDPATRARLAECGAVVAHLDVTLEEALRRAPDDGTRPLLAGDTEALYRRRRDVYFRCADVTLDTTGISPEVAAGLLDEVTRRGAPVVRTRGGSYPILVGDGLVDHVAAFVPRARAAEQALVVTHTGLVDAASGAIASLEDAGLPVHVVEVPEGEASKSLDSAARLYDEFARLAARRHDLVVAFGGGVISDLGGFVASTFNRGMPLVTVPTTLLGQVDAAIGGKTGINLARGKNLVGTFHQPVLVLCDVSLLRTLGDEEFRSGLAEVIKYGFIADPEILEVVEARAPDLWARDPDALKQIVGLSAAIKARVVSGDERETGERAILNYGHTFGHAIEQSRGYGDVRHGEAIAVGMMAAAHLARRLGRIDDDAVARHRRVLESVGLPVTATLERSGLEAAWLRDKKFRAGVRFVLLAEIGRAETGVAVSPEDLDWVLERLKS